MSAVGDRRPTLRTARIRLEPLTAAHADLLVGLDADPAVMRFLTGRGLSRAESLDHLPRRVRPDAAARGLGYWVGHELGRDLDDERFLGWWCLQVDDADPTTAELGYRLARAAWGRGLATEGSRALLSHAFDVVGLRRVWAETMAVNAGSRAVMAKLGMRLERTDVRSWEDPLPGAEQGEVRYVLDAPAG